MTNTNKILKLWIFISVVILTLPILFFTLNFSSLPISNEMDDWTNFSVYFNNIVNPILMCINILLLIKLTYEVANYTEKNMRNDMRQRAYSEISKTLFSLTNILQTSENKQRDMILMRNDIISFSNTMVHLFSSQGYETMANELDDSLNLLSESDYIKNEMTFDLDSNEYEKFLKLYNQFILKRTGFINILQSEILK